MRASAGYQPCLLKSSPALALLTGAAAAAAECSLRLKAGSDTTCPAATSSLWPKTGEMGKAKGEGVMRKAKVTHKYKLQCDCVV